MNSRAAVKHECDAAVGRPESPQAEEADAARQAAFAERNVQDEVSETLPIVHLPLQMMTFDEEKVPSPPQL